MRDIKKYLRPKNYNRRRRDEEYSVEDGDDDESGSYYEPYREPRRQRQERRHSRSRSNRNRNRGAADIDNVNASSNKDDGIIDDDEDDEEVYIVRQQYGYFSILFSIAQTIILGLMMWQCGVAPMSLNPMIGPYPDALSEWGGKNSVLIIDDNEYYRLLSPILLHAGVIHLLGNVAVQLETGVFFEREWGSIRWLIIYIGSAIGSTILSVIVMPAAVSVGSSGAVMGLFGGKLAEVMLRCCENQITKQDRVAATVRREQCCVVTFSVIIVMAFSFIPFIDWAAHLGGLITGFLIGLVMFSFAVQGCYGVWKIIWLLFGIAAVCAYFSATLAYMYSGEIESIEELRDVCGYYKENFENYECNCMREEYIQNNNNGQ
jgi:membrane associated rhomboid family serine protease